MTTSRGKSNAPGEAEPCARRRHGFGTAAFGVTARFVAYHMSLSAPRYATLFCLVVGAAACGVGVQVGMKMLVDAMGGQAGSASVSTALVVFIALIGVETILWRAAGILGSYVVIGSGATIRLDLFDRTVGKPMSYFSGQRAGALGSRITGSAGHFGALVNTTTWNILPPLVDFIGTLLVFVFVDWRLAAILATLVLLLSLILAVYGLRSHPLHQRYARLGNNVSGELIDVVGNIWAVKAFFAYGRERARLHDEITGEAEAQGKSWRSIEWLRVVHSAVLLVIAGGILAWCVSAWKEGSLTTGDVVVISALMFRILHGSRDFALAIVGAAQNIGFISETLAELGAGIPVASGASESTGAEPGPIRFANVSFSYDGRRPVLQAFDLDIAKGQKVGIIGPSGAGKSTLSALLQRLHVVDAGAITIGGHNVNALDEETLRSMLSVVPQDVSLFHRSIFENIRFGRPEAHESDVVAAAKAAQCDDFVRALPDGYHTIVGERGTCLSGGQRQRIGIARAILQRPPVLILDEATSGLDQAVEHRIQTSLSRIMGDTTIVTIAHRLSTLATCDRIVVLSDGRIIEDGCPAELADRGGFYSSLCAGRAYPGTPSRAMAYDADDEADAFGSASVDLPHRAHEDLRAMHRGIGPT